MNKLGRYRRDGTPYPEGKAGLMEWGKDFENKDIHLVKQDTLANGYFVSTVWLGLDHGMLGSVRPLIFETMVFRKGKDGVIKYNELDMSRYSTEQEAIEGHNQMVEKWVNKK